jgi:hypothetical protein
MADSILKNALEDDVGKRLPGYARNTVLLFGGVGECQRSAANCPSWFISRR